MLGEQKNAADGPWDVDGVTILGVDIGVRHLNIRPKIKSEMFLVMRRKSRKVGVRGELVLRETAWEVIDTSDAE